MAKKERDWHYWENHARQMEYLRKGIVMLPKKPIREKSRHKQLKAATMLLRALGNMGKRSAKA